MKTGLFLITVLLLWLSLLNPNYLEQQSLQNIPTAIALLFLAVDIRKNWLTTGSFLCIMAFLWLHILGAHYIYSYVPYDDWSIALTGQSISETFGWQRNHYDRLVHLCFGALLMLPIFNAVRRQFNGTTFWPILFALCAVTTISALYEIVEWLLAVVMSPRNAEAYNGQQGDHWDAQKDMALAFAGSLIVAPLLARFYRKKPA